MKPIAAAWLSLALVPACHSCAASSPAANPAAPRFDVAHSDARAVELADAAMRAMGGRAAWDATRVLAWNFFGRRKHVWDKWTGDYRMEEGERVVLMNLDSGKGRVFDKGAEVTDAKLVEEGLKKAKSIWINDSYWLVMPYKLKDDGVTLKYKGEGALPDGRAADVLVLTFEAVGDTPQNKYDVWIARDTKLVEQWAFYGSRDDAEPKFTTAWGNWQPYGSILLSGERGPDRKLTDISALDAPPASLHSL
ncbi:MAG: hypothetical protein HZA52_20480 [Planctomycetes bacterium]|nr:hypothetical protein [Planctomycetota bacterium]